MATDKKPAGRFEIHEDSLNYSVSGNGIDKKIISNNFTGGKITTFFAGVRIDLTDAKIKDKKKITLELDSTCGGIKIIVPTTWIVQGNIDSMFGKFSNMTEIPDKAEGTLILKGSSVLSGIIIMS